MTRLAIDTNRYRDLLEGDEGVVATLEAADAIVVPFVVLAELRAGFAAGRRRAENERQLGLFLREPGVQVIYADEGTIGSYAELFRQLRAAGTPIPTNDLWIAAIVIQHGLALYSRDRHFDRVLHLVRAEPAKG